MRLFFILLFLFLFPVAYNLSPVLAIYNPLSVPNNKFGIHIIQATTDESSPAASLVNTNGDWGYVTVLIEGKDKDHNKWQNFFDDLRSRHLIPIVRLATSPEGSNWKRPTEGEEKNWANFLDSLNWPIKNRYVTVYNEPNHGTEWGGSVDAAGYAKTLDKTITALKEKNPDFFVLNAGFDASTPQQFPSYQEEISFLTDMEKSVPGIFNKLDGWVSHSYPNPGFVGSPDSSGRGTVRTYLWEEQLLKDLGVSKDLPIFITETGWKHAEGLTFEPNLPSAETLSGYYQKAFNYAWGNSRIVAVTPFLLEYQEPAFDHFSFKLAKSPEFYPFFETIKNMPKFSGAPIQDNITTLSKGEIYSSIVAEQTYSISLTFKNSGQSIWDNNVKLVPIKGGQELGIQAVGIAEGTKVLPNQEYTFIINLKAPNGGKFDVSLNLFNGNTPFNNLPLDFKTEVKAPVILQVMSALNWKDNPSGQYLLRVSGVVGDSTRMVSIDSNGSSEELDAKYLLPDYDFDFTLERPYYESKTIHQTVRPGVNTLNFGSLTPNIFSAILNPKELWNLLPFSN